MVGQDKLFISLFIGGNGTSKTTTGSNIVANIIFGMQRFIPIICPKNEEYDADKYNWKEEWGNPPETWFNYPLFKNYKYQKRGRIISDTTTIREKIIPELKKWLPKNQYKIFDGKNEETIPGKTYQTKKEGKNFESKILFKNGWVIDLMTNEQSITEFESVDLSFCWFDEPTRRSIFYAIVARMRRGGFIFQTFTPLLHSAFIKDELVDKSDGEYCDYLEVAMKDNCIDCGVRGILTHTNIQRMIRSFPEVEREARAFGKFGHLIGLVFKNFNRKIHVITPKPINREDYIVVMAVDPHPRTAHRINWVAINRKGKAHNIAELTFSGNTRQLAEAIKLIEKPNRLNDWRIVERLIDPSADVSDQREEDDRSMRTKLEDDHGLYFELGSKKREQCTREIQDALDYYIDPSSNEFVEEPMLEFFDTCPETIKEVEDWVWEEFKGKAAEERTPKQKGVDKNDHNIENIGRILIRNYSFFESEHNLSNANRVEKHLNTIKKRKQGIETQEENMYGEQDYDADDI